MFSILQPIRSLLVPFSAARKQTCLESIQLAYRHGQYQAALQATEGLYRGEEYTASYCFFRGTILMQIGWLDDAEHWLEEAIPLESDATQLALSQSALGQVLAQQQRFDEAMERFRTSLRCAPGLASTQRSIAETYLLCNGNPREAWKWATSAVETDRTRPRSEAQQLNLSEGLATLAWAVAAVSEDSAEVDDLATEAVLMAERQSVPSAALVHHHCGRAYAALGEELRSELHLQEAARVDPQGMWGRASGRRMPAKPLSIG